MSLKDSLEGLVFILELRFPILFPMTSLFILQMIILALTAYFVSEQEMISLFNYGIKLVDLITIVSFIILGSYAFRRSIKNVEFLQDIEKGKIKLDPIDFDKVIRDVEEEMEREKENKKKR